MTGFAIQPLRLFAAQFPATNARLMIARQQAMGTGVTVLVKKQSVLYQELPAGIGLGLGLKR